MLDGHGHSAVALEGQTARQHFIQHHAGAVDITAGVQSVALGLFGRNIVDAAQRFLRQRLMGVCQTGDAEVSHLDAAVPQYHDVLGLDIPVDDPPAVGVTETTHDLGDEMQRFPPVHVAPALHILLQCNAVNQLHDNIIRPLRAGDVVNGDDIGVAQLSDRQRFIPEAAAELRVLRQLAFQYFDGHKPVKAMTLGLIDIGHTAGADQFQQLVAVIQHFSNVLIHLRSSPFIDFAAGQRSRYPVRPALWTWPAADPDSRQDPARA